MGDRWKHAEEEDTYQRIMIFLIHLSVAIKSNQSNVLKETTAYSKIIVAIISFLFDFRMNRTVFRN